MAVKVFFAPQGSETLFARAFERRHRQHAGEDNNLFVILWHLGAYTWGREEYGPDDIASCRQRWQELGRALDATPTARILILAAEEPCGVARDPKGIFTFPDLLLKALVRDQSAAEMQLEKTLWTTYAAFLRGDSRFVLWAPRDREDSMLCRFCRVMAALPIETSKAGAHPPAVKIQKLDGDKAQWVRHDDLFRFWSDPARFRIEELHGAKADNSEPDLNLSDDERLWARKVALLEHILSRVFVSPKLRLNVLVVENNVKGLKGWDKKSRERHEGLWGKADATGCFGYFDQGRAVYYVVSSDFHVLRSEARNALWVDVYESDGACAWRKRRAPEKIPWPKLDLILQDIMLDSSGGALTGLSYASYYLDACPQALIFLLTGMDIESLATSGDINWNCVDAIVSKRKLGSLWWNYHQAFTKTFGRMFWTAFHVASERKQSPVFGDKESLRNLFGCLRRWRSEPAVLGHGQGLPEMIDHAHRHITALWRLTDDFVGTLVENTGKDDGPLTVENRMLLTLGIWLHDIGHRGNEFSDDPVVVRDTHGGISEYLLLRNPDAYGLQWLAEHHCQGNCQRPTENTAPASNQRLRFRNCTLGCEEGTICPLRKVGILCRQHQSNAPLTAATLARLCEKGKFPTPYTRYREGSDSSQTDLEEWLDRSKPLAGWPGSDVRLLQDFVTGDQLEQSAFMALAGVLRMLDGLQIHRQRVGTRTSIASFREFLRIRFEWCEQELKRADYLLEDMNPGSKEHQAEIGRRDNLQRYERLLNVQYIHWWRQMAVHAVTVCWDWGSPSRAKPDDPAGAGHLRAAIDVQIELDETGLRTMEKLNSKLPLIERGKRGEMPFQLRELLQRQLKGLVDKHALTDRRELVAAISVLAGDDRTERSAAGLWAAHVADDMIWNEHDSQADTTGTGRPGYLDVLPAGVGFRITVRGITSEPFETPLALLKFPTQTA